jgi:glycosyltransferase involved in cell wall biosynthesis
MTEFLAVVEVIAGLSPSAGGPSRTVVQLADSLGEQGEVKVTLLSQALVGTPTVRSRNDRVIRRVVESPSRVALKLGFPVRRVLNQIVHHSRPMLIHNHGLWMPVNYWSAHTARQHGIPLIVHPRGMLEPWALNHKAWKKSIAMLLFQRRDLEEARALVATSLVEYQNIRRLGFRNPVAVIPNGVDLQTLRGEERHERAFGRDTRTALFLSRVYPVKGLINLMHAWSRLPSHNWRLCIAGPDEGGHLAEVMRLVAQLGIGESVEYVGEVDGEAKANLYRSADLFVLPTFTENFGVVVAEALAHGLPVITTRGAPWAELETNRCGWWVEIGVQPLVRALREAMQMSDSERQEMGRRGRAYVQRFDWASVADQTISLYRWILGRGPRPDCVHVD